MGRNEMKSEATSLLRDFVPTLLCAVVVTTGMAWWIWSLRPFTDVFICLLLAALVPWAGSFIGCIVIRRNYPGWSPFLRAFLTSVGGTTLFFLLFGGLASLAEQTAIWVRLARGGKVLEYSTGSLYNTYQGERGFPGGELGAGLVGLWEYTEVGLVIGLISSLFWIPALAVLNVVWISGFGDAGKIFLQTVKSDHSALGQESGKIAILMDLIPVVVLIAWFSVVGAIINALVLGVYLDFGLVLFVLSTLPWAIGLIACTVLRKRLAHGRRWMRSFLIAVYTYIFWLVTQGPLMATAQEATYHLRSILGTHQGPNMFDSPWCFYDGNSGGNWGRGFAEMGQYTSSYLQDALFTLPYVLGFLLLVCFVNDYLIRLFKITFRNASP